MTWEWIDRIQDILTLIAIPVAIILLLRMWFILEKMNKK